VREDPAVLGNLRDGDFASYRMWVRPRIHARASQVPFANLVFDATGAPLSDESLKRHLRQRYLEEPPPI
jgi:carboxypeptidase Taq